MVVGCTENRSTCGTASHGLGLGGLLYLWFKAQKHEQGVCFGMWTAEICPLLLARVLGQAGVVMFQNKNMVIQTFPHHAQSFAHHVTTPALPSCLSRLPWFSPKKRTTFPENTSFSWKADYSRNTKK